MANRAIPQNVIFIWPKDHSGGNGIPATWSRETTLDGYFPKAWGASVAPNNTGGNDAHTHVGNTHTHAVNNSHTHTVAQTNSSNNPNQIGGGTSVDPTAFSNHYHSAGVSTAMSGGSASNAITYPADSTTNNRPPYYDLIFVKSDGTSSFADDMIGLWNTTTAPSNWRFCTDGSNGAPALGNKYPRGAGTTSDHTANGGTTGGSLTHTHALNHSHYTTHTHTGKTGGPDRTQSIHNNGSGANSSMSHQHDVTWDSGGVTTDTYTATLTSGDIEPAYKKILAVQKQADGETAPTGLIGLWLGSAESRPAGWSLCDGTGGTPDMRDKFIKFANATGELGNTGGSNTHDHAASNSHNHSGGSGHTHGVTIYGVGAASHGTGGDDSSKDHNHSLTNNTSGGASTGMTWDYQTMSAQTTTGDGNQPPFRTAALIMLTTTFDIDNSNSVKAAIYYKDVSYDVSTKAMLRTGVAHSFVTADIFRANEQLPSSAKASIVVTNIYDGISSKASIVTTNPKDLTIRASISSHTFEKYYDYRIYDKTGTTFISTWSKEIISEPSFKMVINGGAGEMIVRIDRSFDDFGEGYDVTLFNRVECWCFDRDTVNGVKIYSGYISGYRPVFEGSKDYIEITLLPFIAEMNTIVLRDGVGSTEVVENSLDPSVIAKDVINYYRADGGVINYSDTTVDLTGTTVSYTFQTNTVKEAMDKIIELTPQNWYWFIDVDNMLYLKLSDLSTFNYSFLIGKHIAQMETWRRGEDIINRVYFVGGETGGVNLYRVYTNSASVSSYGLHAYKYVDQRVTLTATADILANRVLNRKKDPEVRTTITILDNNGFPQNKGVDIEAIKPGQTFRIRNIKEPQKTITSWDLFTWDDDVWDQTLAYQAADILQIQSVEYHPNYVRIEASSRLPEISKRIEDISRNLERIQVENNPSTPTVV